MTQRTTGGRTTGRRTATAQKEPHMDTAANRIAFVGAGPGNPGLLTVEASARIGAATLILTDPGVPEEILALAVKATVEHAVGSPAEVAARLVDIARGGQSVVRLVAGDVVTADPVVAEIEAVAAAGVEFAVLPGLGEAVAAASYAGIPVGSVYTVADVRAGAAWERLAAAPGTILLEAAGEHLSETAAALAEAGIDPATPASVTARPAQATQRTATGSLATLDALVDESNGPLIVTVGARVGQRESWWESRSLYGWRVLIPQTRDRHTGIDDLVGEHGGIPTIVPTMAVEPPRSPAQMERSVKGLVDGRYEWLIFTSVNAVKSIWEKFVEFGLDARAFSGVRVACVDDETASAVRDHGIIPDMVSGRPELSAGLLDEFPEYDDILDPVDRILLPRADIATETLAEGLRDRGWEVDDVTAYRTVRAAPPPAPIREAIKAGGFDAVCFTTASTVRNLVGIAGKPHARTIIACLGPKTAEAARDHGLRVDVIPEQPEFPLLVSALAGHASRLRAEGALPPRRRAPRRS